MAKTDDLSTAFDPAPEIAALRAQGADRLDPVRFHFIATLAERRLSHQGEVKRILDRKLADALSGYCRDLAQTKNEAKDAMARLTERFPELGDELQGLFAAADFSGLQRLVARREKKAPTASLAELTKILAQHSPDSVNLGGSDGLGARSELKTIRQFRNTWSKLSVDKQVAEAIEQAPENAGPINSHMLVLRSLAMMRDISPDYLNRFMSYADSLLWLDQVDQDSKPTPKKPPATKATKTTKAAGKAKPTAAKATPTRKKRAQS